VPPSRFFKPAGIPLYELEEVALAADELEAVRLADGEDLYRTEAAARMKISRQTFDRILKRGRGKIARALVQGKALRIQQGEPTTQASDTARKPAKRVRAKSRRAKPC